MLKNIFDTFIWTSFCRGKQKERNSLVSQSMAELTPVAVTLAKDGAPTKTAIQRIVATFLTKEWAYEDAESLNVLYNASFTNKNCIVKRPKPSTGVAEEPVALFIKLHTALDGCMKAFDEVVPSKQEEALFSYEYGNSGLGAQVYGFFQTQDGTLGRIDEYLDARNMEPEDVENEEVRADVAKSFATFHTLQTPLDRKPLSQFYDAILMGLDRYHQSEKLKTLARQGGVNMDKLVDYDLSSKVGVAVAHLGKLNGKHGWCIHDVQFMNTMIKNNPEPEESKVVLIDFEFVCWNYRAFDIGGHFMQKMFKWFDEDNKIANCAEYTKQEMHHFCQEYAARWNHITGDSDTAEQVFREAQYGYILALAFDIHNMLCYMDDVEDKDPLNLHGLNKLFEELVMQVEELSI